MTAALDVFSRKWAQAALIVHGTPTPVLEYLMKQNRRTKPLIGMVKRLFAGPGFQDPPAQVFDLRNDVIHAGKIPTPAQVEDTIRVVVEWIEETMKKSVRVISIVPDSK